MPAPMVDYAHAEPRIPLHPVSIAARGGDGGTLSPASVTPLDEDARAALAGLAREIEECTRCPLHTTRTRAVPGEGDPASDLMFVGEAPGYHEDQQGRPFVGQAGQLLEELLASIGLSRREVFIANVLKSRPPNNRDPLPEEVAACQPYLWRQIEAIKPKVVCSLGNHATKLLSGNPAGITRVHGRPQVVRLGRHVVYLYPIFHPAAALYTRAMLATLQDDFRRLPELLALPRPSADAAAGDQPGFAGALAPAVTPEGGGQRSRAAEPPPAPDQGEQLGLF
jgi:uracil-DNA glycosylase